MFVFSFSFFNVCFFLTSKRCLIKDSKQSLKNVITA